MPLRLEFYQAGGERVIRLGWRTPSDIRDLASGRFELNNTMQTYLPSGADWYDFWTNEIFKGGQTEEKECPLNILPLYVRAGSIVPMGPVMQYATEKPDAPYEIQVYPGADAKFTVYEDDNETYDYEKESVPHTILCGMTQPDTYNRPTPRFVPGYGCRAASSIL